MSGDTLTDKKARQLLNTASKRPSFREDIKVLREKYSIPIQGYDTEIEAKTWIFNNKGKIVEFLGNSTKESTAWLLMEKEFEADLIKFLKKHGLYVSLLYYLEEYLLYGKPFKNSMNNKFFGCAVENPRFEGGPLSEEEGWKEMDISYARLLIHEHTTPEDVCSFVKNNWHQIKLCFGDETKIGNQTSNRIRTRPKDERDSFLFENSQKSKEELGDPKAKYKEIILGRLVKKEFGEDMSFEAIRKAIKREKRRRRDI